MSLSDALTESKVGGNLILNFKVVEGLKTFPAFCNYGKPSAPVIDIYALHILFKYASKILDFVGFNWLLAHGNFSVISAPNI